MVMDNPGCSVVAWMMLFEAALAEVIVATMFWVRLVVVGRDTY